MNKTYRLLQLLVIICLSFSGFTFAQEVDTVEINGQEFFVYPFKVEVDVHSKYSGALKSGMVGDFQIDYETYSMMMTEETGEVISRREFNKFQRQFKRRMRRYNRGFNEYEYEGNSGKHLNKKFYKAVRKNPYPMLQQRIQMNNDLVPMLDPIPDGKYIQYYEDFCLTNEKGECSEQRSFIAGYFTMKDNTLDGEAVWIDLQGDTLKHGWFKNGVKEGEWMFARRILDYNIDEDQAEQYIERGYPEIDTTIEFITYQGGAKHGAYRKFMNSKYPIIEGNFDQGVESATWTYRNIVYRGFGSKRRRIRDNEAISKQYTYEPNDSLVTNPIWIRKGLARTYNASSEQFEFYPKYSIPDIPTTLYGIAFEKEEDLELIEEVDGAPYDMDYMEESYYEEEYYGGYDFGYSEFEARTYDVNESKYKMRGVFLDSIGGRPSYTGTYEAYYPNGQLAYRYNFENGNFVDEDTIFWDNGLPHDVITFDTDSNQYIRSIYDYTGKIYKEVLYDSLGDYIDIKKTYETQEKFEIEGLEVYSAGYGNYYYYNVYDTLGSTESIPEPLILYRSWCKDDSMRLFTTSYHPVERKISSQGYSATGKEMSDEYRTYAEDFESWTGKKFMRLGDLELEKTSSGALYEYYESDSIPIKNIIRGDRFDIADNYQLKRNGENYTGPVEIKFGKRNLSISKKDLTISLPASKYTNRKLTKDLEKYRLKGKTKYPIIMDLIDGTEANKDLESYIFGEFFSNPLGGFFKISSEDHYYREYEDYSKKNAPATLNRVEGFMLDGKPQGLWVGFDQYGKKTIEVPYDKGEAHGEVIEYKYAEALDEDEYGWMQYENPLRDSFPEKKVHYVSNRSNFSNGKMDGTSTSYSWYGEITEESNFVDGWRDGPSMERNKLATTKANYRQGEPDGFVKTYLTLTPGDSILLYNLNFQDGLLQGESKAYHTNGKLAKRGFFLDGMPIEDYEAYDSLGFKYHYVKFQYSFPIEEKIWEENELSVRYLFDWQDSIYFEPSDITTSQSLEAVIADLGLGGGYFERPYYGRHSLVNKNGIDYHMTKYYPNDTISRDGDLSDGRKVGCWKYYSYGGELLYEVDYQDSIIEINDSIKFKSKGVLTDFDADGNVLYESFMIEMYSKYDCAHTDHYEIRQLYTKWEANDTLGRMNGFVRNFYDNGTLQSEGNMKNGLPDGVWKYYDPYGQLNQYGVYVLGKRDARWLSGDLSKTKYLGDICLNPNLPDLEDEIKYRENLLDIKITNYNLGKSLNSQYYDIDMNRFIDEDESDESEEGEELEEGTEEE